MHIVVLLSLLTWNKGVSYAVQNQETARKERQEKVKPILDISFYQAPSAINYDLLAANVSGVILRAAYSNYKDTAFERHYSELTARGVPLGAYHYIIGSAGIIAQSNAFNAITDGKEFRLGRWIDVEDTRSGTRLYRNNVLDYAALQPDMGIYTSKGAWNAIMGGIYLNDRKLWVAHYTTAPSPLMPTGWTSWWLWQHSSTGKLAGYNGNLDLNHFYGTEQQYADWIGGEETPPEPIPPETKLFDAKVYNWATPYVNIRKEPTTYSQDLGDIYPNTIVPVYEIVGSWYKITYNYISGYVMSKYLQRLDYEPPVVLEYAYYGPVYNQRDIRWATHSLGTRSTIGAYGCLMTCASMVCNKFGHASNPLQLNDWLTANEGYLDGNLFLWDAIERLYPDMHFDGFVYAPSTTQIRSAILAGILPMMYVDFDDDTPLIEMHWVLGIGVTTNDVIIADPWTGTIGKLSEMYPKSVIRYGSYRKQM